MKSRHRGRPKTGAFSLVELMSVVAIIGLLTAISVPAFMRANMQSRASRMKNDLRVLFDAFNLYAIEYGDYPGEGGYYYTDSDAAPQPLIDYLEDSRWEDKTPFGGHYFYWNRPVFDDTIGENRYIPFLFIDNWNYNFFDWPSVPLMPSEVWQSLDEDIDDGNLATGRLQMHNMAQVIYTLDESSW